MVEQNFTQIYLLCSNISRNITSLNLILHQRKRQKIIKVKCIRLLETINVVHKLISNHPDVAETFQCETKWTERLTGEPLAHLKTPLRQHVAE